MGHKYTLNIGTILNGKYEIIPVDEDNDILGIGGFGITYKCFDKSTNREIVIKEFFPSDFAIREGLNVSPKSSSDKESFELGLKSFIKETKTLAKFHGHPNIIDIYERFEENNTSYFVMPFQKGRSLKDIMNEKDFTEKEIIELVTAILDGLKEVHAEGILHRDLKPDNIFMKDDKIPVLIDFGSAKDTLSERTKLLTGVVALSAGYAAPEQYSRKLKQGPFTDIYALGIIMYQLITKSKDNNIPTSTDRTLDVPLEWPENINKQYSNHLIAVAKRASSLSADDRYQDAMSMRYALLENPNAPSKFKNPPPPPLPEPPKRELDFKKIAIVGGILLLSIATISSIMQSNEEDKNLIEVNSSKKDINGTQYKNIELLKNVVSASPFIDSESYKVYKDNRRAFYLGAMIIDANYIIKTRTGEEDSIKFYFLLNKIKLNGGISEKGEQKRIERLLNDEKWSEISKEIRKIDSNLQHNFKESKEIDNYISGRLMEEYRLLVENIKTNYRVEDTKMLIKHPILNIKSIDLPNIRDILNSIKKLIADSSDKLSKEQVEELSKILNRMTKDNIDA